MKCVRCTFGYPASVILRADWFSSTGKMLKATKEQIGGVIESEENGYLMCPIHTWGYPSWHIAKCLQCRYFVEICTKEE